MKRSLTSVLMFVTLPVMSLTAYAATNSLHPDVELLDRQGNSVVETRQAMSALESCADCHDGEFITENHDHPLHIASNCLLCHSKNYDTEAYFQNRNSDQPSWAELSGLANAGLADNQNGQWQWSPLTQEVEGFFSAEDLGIQAAKSAPCGQCHGIVYNGSEPLVINLNSTIGRLTRLEGAIYSGQKLSNSGLNVAGKDTQDRSFDVHAERLLECTDCHRAANNPVHGGARGDKLSHLKHDPRLVDLSAFLERPDHNLMIGVSGGDGNCQGCHEPAENHSWLPEVALHFETVACQACHITQMYGPATQLVDDSVRNEFGQPLVQYRIQGDMDNALAGFEPLLLKRPVDGKFAPYNVSLNRYWRDAADNKNVPAELLDQAWNKAGLSPIKANTYLNIDELEQLKSALISLGIVQPEIATVVKAVEINHGVSRDEWALKECEQCHSDNGRLQATMPLAAANAGFVAPASLSFEGKPALIIEIDSNNQLQAKSADTGDYQLKNRNPILLMGGGLLAVLGTLVSWQWLKRSRR